MDQKASEQPSGEMHPTKKQISRWGKLRSAVRLIDEDATPPNWKVIALMVFAMFGSAYSLTFIFPFLPSMILYFGYKEEEKGYYTGLVASAMFCGRILGSYFWGWLSDKKGRKPIIVINLILICFANIGFAFSTTLGETIAWRFINGVVNGLVGICKTVLYETSDNTNQTVGIACISLAWGAGVILGPLLSGYVAEPVDRYDVLQDSEFLKKFPYFLPGFIAAVVATLPAIVCMIFFEETVDKKKETVNVDEGKESCKEIENKTCSREKREAPEETDPMKTPYHNTSYGEHLTDLAFIDEHDHDREMYGSSNLIFGLGAPSYSIGDLTGDIYYEKNLKMASHNHHTDDIYLEKKDIVEDGKNGKLSTERLENVPEDIVVKDDKKSCFARCRNLGVVKILSEKDVRLVVVLYSILSFAFVGLDEVMTVWVSTDPVLGGLGFTSEQIGNALGVSSLPLIFVQIFLFTFLVRKFGSIKVFYCANLYLIVFSVTIVCLRPLYNKPSALWPCILVFMALQKLAGIMCFSASSLFINNSVHPSQAGSVNGLAMTLTSIGRTLGPTVGGSIFAWSISHGVNIGFPFDINCIFIVFGLVFLSSNVVCAFMPKHLEVQSKKE